MITMLVDLMVVGVQGYLISTFICRLYKVKAPYQRSHIVAFIQLTMAYIMTNYVFCVTSTERIISGTVTFIIFGFFFFEGSILYKVVASVSEYIIFLMLDLTLMLLFKDFLEAIQSIPMAEQKLLGRNLLTTVVFFMCLVQELILFRNKEKYNKFIVGLGISIGIVQFIIWTVLSKTNIWGMVDNQLIVTILFSFALMGGYGIVTRLYKNYCSQNKKANEIEQIRLEMQYQKNFYQNAVKQGEILKNIKHDIRNQLQTVNCFIHSNSQRDKKRAVELLDEIKRNIS